MDLWNYATLMLLGQMQLLMISSAQPSQPSVTIRFTRISFQAVENEESIAVQVGAEGSSDIDLKLIITPFTFDEYDLQFGRRLPKDIQMQSQNISRADYSIQVGGQQDFLRVAQKLTIEASRNLLNSDFLVPIPINDDKIDEDPEGFIVLIEVSEETANNRLAPLINYINDGLTIGIIVDDDVINFSFERPLYTISESDGQLSDTIRIMRGGDTELDYTLNIIQHRGFFIIEDLNLTFPSKEFSVPVPITISPGILMANFSLTLVSLMDNPSNNFNFVPYVNTQVIITDDVLPGVGSGAVSHTSFPPTISTSPTNSTQPTNSTSPTNSTQPTNSTSPTNSTQPTNSTSPTNSTQPTNSSSPTNSTQPTNSSSPTNSTQPTNSTSPTNSSSSTETAVHPHPLLLVLLVYTGILQ